MYFVKLGLLDKENIWEGDFIPGGEWMFVEDGELNFQETEQADHYRCCVQSSYDPQSGPIWCGEKASLVSEVQQNGPPIGYFGMCSRHQKIGKAAGFSHLPLVLTSFGLYTGTCPTCYSRLKMTDDGFITCPVCKKFHTLIKGHLYEIRKI